MVLAARLANALSKLKVARQTIAVSETSSGGLLASSLLAQPGASKFFAGGVVAYTKAAKQVFLSLPPDGSRPTSTEPHARELAKAACMALQADWGIGETGVAGPTANARGVSPGVCAVAVVGPNGFVRSRMLFPDDGLSAADAYGQPPKVPREEMMRKFADEALVLLCEAVEQQQQ